MDPAHPPTPHPTDAPAPAGRAVTSISSEGQAAVTALARALEVYDPDAALRASLVASVIRRVATASHTPHDIEADAIAAALLTDVGALVAHGGTAISDELDLTRNVLVAGMVARLPTLGGAARALRHRFERWDGTGGPHALSGSRIPAAARLLAVASRLVGRPRAGQPTHLTARLIEIQARAGTELDPNLVDHTVEVVRAGNLDTISGGVDAGLALLDDLVGHRRAADAPLSAILSIGAAIDAADRVDEVLGLITEHARSALGAASVSIGRLDTGRASVDVLVNTGDLGAGVERFPVTESYSILEHAHLSAIAGGVPIARTMSDTSDVATIEELTERGLASEIAAPISIGDRPWGVVWATTRAGQRELDDGDVEVLRIVASQVGRGVQQAERFAELEQLALRDPLTGLGNRRVLEATLRDIFARSPIDRQDTAVIMCDVDGLKFVNDTMGHEVGDELLAGVGTTLRAAVQGYPNTTVCRVGGDEFCIVVDGGGLLSGPAIARRAEELFERTGENRSLSVGLAVATFEMDSPSDLLRAADENQYANKRRRRTPGAEVGTVGDDSGLGGHPGRRRRRDVG